MSEYINGGDAEENTLTSGEPDGGHDIQYLPPEGDNRKWHDTNGHTRRKETLVLIEQAENKDELVIRLCDFCEKILADRHSPEAFSTHHR